MAIKSKSYEKLDFDNIERVIGFLSQDNPITKKEACEILNIRYNTTRLQRIIDEHNDLKHYRDTRRNQNKGKRASKDEIKSVVQSYLEGDNISEIATSNYRSNAFVKGIIQRVGVPEKLSKEAHSKVYRHKYQMLPEECVSEEFEVGELVWSVRDNGIAKILRECTLKHQFDNAGYGGYQDYSKCINYEEKYGAKGYTVWAYDPVPQDIIDKSYFPYLDGRKCGYYAFSLAYDLGSLRHLEEIGVTIY